MTHLDRPVAAQGRFPYPHRNLLELTNPNREAFAEALANGAPSIAAAAREVGISRQLGSRFYQQMLAEAGEAA